MVFHEKYPQHNTIVIKMHCKTIQINYHLVVLRLNFSVDEYTPCILGTSVEQKVKRDDKV